MSGDFEAQVAPGEAPAAAGTAIGAADAEWTAVGLATGAADRRAAEAGVEAAYRAAGLRPPRHVVWLGSPAAGALAAALLAGAVAPADDSATALAEVPDDLLGILTALAGVPAALAAQGCPVGEVIAGASVRAAIRTVPWAAARGAVHDALGPTGWAHLWTGAGAPAWRLVMDRVAGPLRSRLREDLMVANRPALLDALYGQHDAAWLATFAAAGKARPGVVGDPAYAALEALGAVARSAGWWWAYTDVAILTERPVELHRDNLGRLHHGDGPALRFPDGYALHAWRGMPIPTSLVAELPHLTHARITEERNAELRRVMLEHYGYDRYLRESGATKVDEDSSGTLWRLSFRDDEALVMVEVVNSTAEPDGTFRRYWLRVPPETSTAREGVAWTFGLTTEEYVPLVQT